MDIKEIQEKMEKTINVLKQDLAAIREGKANAAVLDKISIDYYGTQTPVTQLSNISVPEARTLVIQPYDASVLKSIEKAIQASDIGINPQNDGKVIRLIFPPLTEERRKELVKTVAKTAENSKIAVRSIRRDGIEKFKSMEKKSEITEDDLKKAEKDIQDTTDKFCKQIDDIAAKKSSEILEI